MGTPVGKVTRLKPIKQWIPAHPFSSTNYHHLFLVGLSLLVALHLPSIATPGLWLDQLLPHPTMELLAVTRRAPSHLLPPDVDHVAPSFGDTCGGPGSHRYPPKNSIVWNCLPPLRQPWNCESGRWRAYEEALGTRGHPVSHAIRHPWSFHQPRHTLFHEDRLTLIPRLLGLVG
jgi:hypothetical protein